VSADIEVLGVWPVTGSGSLRALANVRVGAVTLRSCRVVQQDGGEPWVALPQVPIRRKADGSGAGWVAVVEIADRELLDQLCQAVLAAWRQGQP
jgi:hypothetical protein